MDMLDVLVAVKIVKRAAKRLHYGASGDAFYGLHLLADKVDFGTGEDDLKEAYFLGMKEVEPPTELRISERAKEIQSLPDGDSNEALVKYLYDACVNGLYSIEEAKREPGLFAGVHAIVDGMSQTMLTIKGLCWRTLCHADDGDSDNNA